MNVVEEIMKALISLSVLIIAASLVASLVIDIIIYCSNDDLQKYPKIKFKSFKKFYAVNPSRWKLEDKYVMCIWDNRYSNEYKKYGYYENDYIRLRFGFLETYWYKT